MNRIAALIGAVIGGAAAAFAITIAGTAIVAGVLWLYVFGDDPWPRGAEAALNIAIPLFGLGAWALFGWLIYRLLRRRA